MLLGGQTKPRGGYKTNRYTSERPRITSVRANTSEGQSVNSSVIDLPVSEYQIEAGVGSSLCERSVSTACSWSAIFTSSMFPALTPLAYRIISRSDELDIVWNC